MLGLGDVLLFFGILLALGIALPGLLLAWTLLFPATIERARHHIQTTPWRCGAVGLAWLLVGSLVIAILLGAPSGVTKLLGWLLLFAMLAQASLGAAGIAALMGQRMRQAGMQTSASGALLRGAIALELAVIVPLIGWFIVLPLATICALGAASLALRRRPRVAAAVQQEAVHVAHTS